jgi:4-hydroxy-tetrahydrodipicolinate synthase
VIQLNNIIPKGVWPVMLTPFTKDNKVDYEALGYLTDWYISKGVSGLFAVCQSSEMFYLTVEERVSIASYVKERGGGRVPVIASGHISEKLDDQIEELQAMAQTGVDGLVLTVNRLVAEDEDDSVFLSNLYKIMEALPVEMPLGFYECPYPYKRLLSPEILGECAKTGRFFFHKDTSCDQELIRSKIKAIKGTSLKLFNANTVTLRQSLQDGGAGYSGIMANFHPELYVWLCQNYDLKESKHISDIMAMCALIERQLYPVNAKYYLKLSGINIETICRVKNDMEFTEAFKEEIKALLEVTKELKKELQFQH